MWFTGSSVSNRAIFCCVVITIGYLIGLDQEGLSGMSGVNLYFFIFNATSPFLN